MSDVLLEARDLAAAIGGRTLISCLDLKLQNTRRNAWRYLAGFGAGKTTLLHTLAGLRAPLAGDVRLCGQQLSALAPRRVAQLRGVLLQQQIDAFPASVLETALIGRHPWDGALGPGEAKADARMARQALAGCGPRGTGTA